MQYRILSAAIFLAVLARVSWATSSAPAATPTVTDEPPKPNVILILTDDQGSVDMGAYGAADLETPAMDALARRGVRFTQFYSGAPVCSPSRAAVLTGRYPDRAGMPSNAPSEKGKPGMPTDEVTIAEVLRMAGYATCHVGKWHLGYTPETMPNAQGFDWSFGHMGGCIDNWSHFFYWQGPNRHDLWRNGEEVHAPGRFFGDLMVEEAAAFLRSHRERPFFLYFAMNMPHYPYQGDPKWLARYAALPYPRNLYAAFLSTQDERIGRLLVELDALGLRERTIVILQSDNGHSTEERAHSGGGSAGPYRGAKFSLFEGGIRMPAILSWPGRIGEGEVRSQTAHACDWLPTIAELCGVPLPEPPTNAGAGGKGGIDAKGLDGRSLVAVLRSADAPSPHGMLHWTFGPSRWAVREGDWKLLVGAQDTSLQGPEAKVESPFLVHLGDDPGERRNLAPERPEIVERLRKAHEEWRGGLAAERPGK